MLNKLIYNYINQFIYSKSILEELLDLLSSLSFNSNY